VQLASDGTGFVTILGKNLEAGMNIQAIVSRGTWQGAQLVRGGQYALLGTTVAPGFEFEDFEMGRRSALLRSFPAFRDLIIALTREEPAKERS
jgi:predicted cupin superfamily sugar epimerase